MATATTSVAAAAAMNPGNIRITLHKRQNSLSHYQSTCITKHYALNNQILDAFESHYRNNLLKIAYHLGLKFVETALLEIPKHGYFYTQKHEALRSQSSVDAIRVTQLLQEIIAREPSFATECYKLERLTFLANEQYERLPTYEKNRAKVEQELHPTSIIDSATSQFRSFRHYRQNSANNPYGTDPLTSTILACGDSFAAVFCPGTSLSTATDTEEYKSAFPDDSLTPTVATSHPDYKHPYFPQSNSSFNSTSTNNTLAIPTKDIKDSRFPPTTPEEREPHVSVQPKRASPDHTRENDKTNMFPSSNNSVSAASVSSASSHRSKSSNKSNMNTIDNNFHPSNNAAIVAVTAVPLNKKKSLLDVDSDDESKYEAHSTMTVTEVKTTGAVETAVPLELVKIPDEAKAKSKSKTKGKEKEKEKEKAKPECQPPSPKTKSKKSFLNFPQLSSKTKTGKEKEKLAPASPKSTPEKEKQDLPPSSSTTKSKKSKPDADQTTTSVSSKTGKEKEKQNVEPASPKSTEEKEKQDLPPSSSTTKSKKSKPDNDGATKSVSSTKSSLPPKPPTKKSDKHKATTNLSLPPRPPSSEPKKSSGMAEQLQQLQRSNSYFLPSSSLEEAVEPNRRHSRTQSDYDLQRALFLSGLGVHLGDFRHPSDESIRGIPDDTSLSAASVPGGPPGAKKRDTDAGISIELLSQCIHEDFDSLRDSGRVIISRIPTYQGRIPGSTNGCTVIAPLICLHHFHDNCGQVPDPGLDDRIIAHVLDQETPSILPLVRQKLGLVEDAFLIPADAHEALMEEQYMCPEQFYSVCGGNIMADEHLDAFIKELSVIGEKKLAATFFFHEHVVTILQLKRSSTKVWFDFINSLPARETLMRAGETVDGTMMSVDTTGSPAVPTLSPMSMRLSSEGLDFGSEDDFIVDYFPPENACRIRCLDGDALKATLRWYACSSFSESNQAYINNYQWDENLPDFDPRVFQAFLWTEA